MSAVRLAAIALALAAAVAGGMLDRVTSEVPMPQGQFYVLAVDFHVHGFIGDGALPPWEVPREALRRGLQVIALTNHNQRWGALAVAAFSSGWPLVLVGEEITAPKYHMSAVGLTHRVDWRLSAKDAIDAVHAQGGIAIASHPLAKSWRDMDEGALARLDGTEVAHPMMDSSRGGREELRAFHERARRLNPHVAPIGSSDFHFASQMGRYRTYVLARALTEDAVFQAVREGRTVARDAEGRLTGRPDDVAAVERHLAAHPVPPGPTLAQRLAAACVLLALAGLALPK
jgi:predicted metal-dependent phosphoesterase TrpH